ncbi:hypothetical protein EVAR_90403_1 [Eumeta japonica]|uniref:Uncharacterized protein n=1 Tax=Eumeta variegata TaxID=151549 RepID=A0A4C1YCV7_EUMVA|nr:hypothetical protein EVAR_90403_1 [Eumeta japonica]
MAVRIAPGAVARTGGSEGFAIGYRSRHNFPRNIGRRFIPYKAMNLFPGRVLGMCRVQPEPVARSLTHRPRMRYNRYGQLGLVTKGNLEAEVAEASMVVCDWICKTKEVTLTAAPETT